MKPFSMDLRSINLGKIMMIFDNFDNFSATDILQTYEILTFQMLDDGSSSSFSYMVTDDGDWLTIEVFNDENFANQYDADK